MLYYIDSEQCANQALQQNKRRVAYFNYSTHRHNQLLL